MTEMAEKTPEDTSDKLANLEFRSKMTYFKCLDKSSQSSETERENQERRNRQSKPVSCSTSCQVSPQISTTEGTDRINNTFDAELIRKMEEVSARPSRDWSPHDMEIFQHPMCMISSESVENEEGEEVKIMLKTEQDVFAQIEKIDLPIVVVAVVGLYRTGKSYLMNRLAQSSKGFALGDTIESTTKGIWAWCKMHPEKLNTVLLLLDTEGLGDVEKGDPSHDNKIFTLAALLCNCLVYNMKGAFDNDAVSKLTFVTEMAKNIRYRGQSSEDNQALKLILPDFVLCLRDFSLKLMKDGERISENEYLELSLADKKGKAHHFNKPRECIRKYFPKRTCFAFPVPGDGDVLENLETLNFSDLSERFKDVTTRFVSHIYCVPPKELLTSKPVNGQMFVTLAEHYVTAIKHGAIPDVDDAFSAVAKIENAKIQRQAVESFEKQMQEIVLPVSTDVLGQLYTKSQQTAFGYLRKNVVHDKNGTCENEAQMRMDNFLNKIKESNDEKIKEMCEMKLKEAYAKYLERNIENKVYETAGGYRKFQRDIDRLKQDFESDLRDFKDYEIMWTWHGFVKHLNEIEAAIIQADEDLSQKEKEDEQKNNEEKMKTMLEQQKKVQMEALDKQKKDLQSHYDKLEKDRVRQLEIERKKFQTLTEEKLKFEKATAEKEVQRLKQEQEQRKKDMEKDRQRYEREIEMYRQQQQQKRKQRNKSSCVLS